MCLGIFISVRLKKFLERRKPSMFFGAFGCYKKGWREDKINRPGGGTVNKPEATAVSAAAKNAGVLQ